VWVRAAPLKPSVRALLLMEQERIY